MMMQRTSQAVVHIQNNFVFKVFQYIDGFGGAEREKVQAERALSSL